MTIHERVISVTRKDYLKDSLLSSESFKMKKETIKKINRTVDKLNVLYKN